MTARQAVAERSARIAPESQIRSSSAPGLRWTSDRDIISIQTEEPTLMSNKRRPGLLAPIS